MQKPRIGRPPKPEGQHSIRRIFTFPPDLWKALADRVPSRERSRFVQEAVREKLLSVDTKRT